MSVLFTKHSAVGHKLTEQGKSDGFDGCDRPSNLAPLHWRHNDHDGVSNHQSHGCLLNRLFRRRSKKTPKLRVTGLCVGNSPGPVNSPHKGPVTRNMFPFDDVIMQIGFKSSINQATWLLKFDEWPKTNNKAPLRWHQALCIISNPSVNWKWSHSPETLNSGKNWRFFFVPRDLEIGRMTLKNNRAPLLYYIFKLCAAFQSYWYIQTGVTVRKRWIRAKIGDFLPALPWKLTNDIEKQ